MNEKDILDQVSIWLTERIDDLEDHDQLYLQGMMHAFQLTLQRISQLYARGIQSDTP